MKKSNPKAAIYERMIRNLLLKEAVSLTRSQIAKHPWRVDKFIERVKKGTPFTVGGIQKPVTLKILKPGDPLRNLDLSLHADEQLVRDWILDTSVDYDILPAVDNVTIKWKEILKDHEMVSQSASHEKSTIPEKFLQPVSLGIANDQLVAISTIRSAIRQKIQDPNLSSILLGLVDAAELYEGDIPAQAQSSLSTISDADKRAIIKDFGEVLAAIMVGKTKTLQFSFPSSASNPLGDFKLSDGSIYSVKSLGGSGSSPSNYLMGIDEILAEKEADEKMKEAAKELKQAIKDVNMQDRIINLARLVRTDKNEVGRILSKIQSTLNLGPNFNSTDLYNATGNSASAKLATVKNFLGTVQDRPINKSAINAAFLGKLASVTAEALNNSIYKDVIIKAVQLTAANQVYISFDSMSNPKKLVIADQSFKTVNAKNVKFVNKDSSNEISKGGVVVKVTEHKNIMLLQDLIKETIKFR